MKKKENTSEKEVKHILCKVNNPKKQKLIELKMRNFIFFKDVEH